MKDAKGGFAVSGDGKSSNGLGAILMRAIVLAFAYPILKSIYSSWSEFSANFPGSGPVPYFISAAVFIGTFVSLGWILGAAPTRWAKTWLMNLWRSIMIKKLSALGSGSASQNSWRGKEVAYAEVGRFGEEEVASVFSLGIITADYGDEVSVFFIAPPGGTSKILYVRKKSGLLWLTGRPIEKHFETFVTAGNGVNPHDFLPKTQ